MSTDVLSVADKYDIHRRTRLHSELIDARWHTKRNLWICCFRDTQTNETFVREGAALISAVGTLDKPMVPRIPGAESFRGEVFHSARWQHKTDFNNKNVVVLGNGASATQFIAPLTEMVGPKGSVTQIVRSAHWWIRRVC
jgi:cation diffusion facilitator CzcD-associated flavoprotein CzcO